MGAQRSSCPGIIYQEVPSRRYPASDMAAHLFGYVGEVTEAQLQRADYKGVEPGTIVGQAGVEQAYNQVLMGAEGNKAGRRQQRRPRDPRCSSTSTSPTEGQRAAADDRRRRAEGDRGRLRRAVRLQRRRGRARSAQRRSARRSSAVPAYDPNAFAAGIDRATWASLNTDELKPLQNRALQGTYSPGSTFKMAVGDWPALEEGVITPDFRVHCGGGATFYGRYFECWKKGGHGSVDLRHAIEQSCDVYFYTRRQHARRRPHPQVGDAARPRRQDRASICRTRSQGSCRRPSGSSARRRRSGTPARRSRSRSARGRSSVTPLSLAVYDDDARQRRHARTRRTCSRRSTTGKGWKPVPPPPPQSRSTSRLKKLDGDPPTACGWSSTAPAPAGAARIEGHDVCGKTGTAQVISLDRRAWRARGKMDLRDHGWFVFFAPRDNPEIAGVVFARARRARPTAARRSRSTSSRPTSRRRKASRCRRRRRRDARCASTTRSVPPGAGGAAPAAPAAAVTADVRTTAVSSTSTGCCSAPSCCSPGSASR